MKTQKKFLGKKVTLIMCPIFPEKCLRFKKSKEDPDMCKHCTVLSTPWGAVSYLCEYSPKGKKKS